MPRNTKKHVIVNGDLEPATSRDLTEAVVERFHLAIEQLATGQGDVQTRLKQ